ncbi:MAG: hypothetical protein WD278_08690 [Pirellulales bacterium]
MAGIVAGSLVVSGLLAVLVGRDQRVKRWARFAALPVAVLANATALGAGGFVVLLALTGLLADGKLGTRVDWGWAFVCLPGAAAVSLTVLAWSPARRPRWLRGAAIGLNGILAGYGFWYWYAHERGTDLPAAPPLGALVLLALAAFTVMVLVWDGAPITGGSGPANPAGKRRPSLRGVLVTVPSAAICAVFWISFPAVREHRRPTATLEAMGCTVAYHAMPKQLSRLDEVDSLYPYLCDVRDVFVVPKSRLETADGLRFGQVLNKLPQLRQVHIQRVPSESGGIERNGTSWSLHLNGPSFTDDTLAAIADFRVPAQQADFSHSRITDDGLAYLAKLTRLQDLRLTGTPVTGRGLRHLRGLEMLALLDLSDAAVDDAGLGHLPALKSIRWLNLDRTRITDAGLKHLAGLSGLQEIGLQGTPITGEGVRHLVPLPLLSLDLSYTRVGDDQISHLRQLNGLRSLDLMETRMTPQGASALEKALPECLIVWGPFTGQARFVSPPSGVSAGRILYSLLRGLLPLKPRKMGGNP